MTDNGIAADSARIDIPGRIHLAVAFALSAAMTIELILLVVRGRWLHAFLVIGILAIVLTPVLFSRRLPIAIPSELQIVAVLFIFATLFLGEVRDYYERIWWWDLALHASAGILLGLFGFFLVYILNENRHVDLHMRPLFVALFAFFFATSIGALWEIFEFTMDSVFNLTMQKPKLRDQSGLTDTMLDLVVDTIGAAAVSLGGWRYMARPRRPYIDSWARRFVDRNPQLFGKW